MIFLMWKKKINTQRKNGIKITLVFGEFRIYWPGPNFYFAVQKKVCRPRLKILIHISIPLLVIVYLYCVSMKNLHRITFSTDDESKINQSWKVNIIALASSILVCWYQGPRDFPCFDAASNFWLPAELYITYEDL